MVLYNIDNNSRLSIISENPFKLEKEIQNLLENNLSNISDLTFVKSEFTIENYRIDTLAFDEQSKSFVIIEYKRNKTDSMVDQGFTYLNVMLSNKADFILEYNENKNKTLKREDVDWSQSKIIFVSTSFTDYQIKSVNFQDFAIELWEIKRYKNNIIQINKIKKTKSSPNIKTIVQNSENDKYKIVENEIKVYTENDHFMNKTDEIIDLYNKFKNSILELSDDIEIMPKKLYIAFKKNSNICDIEIQKNKLKIYVNAKYGKLDDSKNIFEDCSNKGHWGNGDYFIQVSDDKNLEYIMSVIKQVII